MADERDEDGILGTRLLREGLALSKPGDKKYFDGSSEEFLRVIEIGDDMARWRASLEPVASLEYRGLTVCKILPWAAGPVGRAGAVGAPPDQADGNQRERDRPGASAHVEAAARPLGAAATGVLDGKAATVESTIRKLD